MRLHAAFLVGASLCVPPIQAGEAPVGLSAAELDCSAGMHLGQAPAVPARAHGRLEHYLQFHAEALQSGERGAWLPWSHLRMRAD